jgi:hypothetical protein
MSGSAALEYGFPSSHSTNAVSVTFYAIYMLRQTDEYSPAVNLSLQALFYLYAVSIILGRLYCGMHGFLDVLVGSILGALITVFQLTFSDWIDSWIFSGSYRDLVIATLVMYLSAFILNLPTTVHALMTVSPSQAWSLASTLVHGILRSQGSPLTTPTLLRCHSNLPR